MRKRIAKICSIGLCICMAMGLYIPSQAADNLMAGEAGALESFTLLPGATIDATAGPDGGKALVLTGETAAAEVYVDNLEANKTYGFSAMLKSNADGAAAITVEAMAKGSEGYTSKKGTYSQHPLQHYKYAGGTDTYVSTGNAWRPLQFNFTLPLGANAAKITVSCKVAEQTVSFADFSVYTAANLVSNGDFEGVSVYDANPTTVSGGLVLDTTGTAGNWRVKKADATKSNTMRDPIKTWGPSHFTKEDTANPQGYAYTEPGERGAYGISQVIPLKAGQMYRLAFDWGVWYTDGAAVMQLWTQTTSTAHTVQWVHGRLGEKYVENKTWAHTEHYFYVPNSDTIDDMTEVCLYWNDNGGMGRTVIDNVILEPVNNTFTTSFSENYAALDAMPEGGNTTVTVKNTCRIPADAGRNGEVRNYSILVALYKMENNTVVLENVRKEDFTLTVSGEKDAIKTVTQDVAVPETGNGVEYKIVSYLWNENMKPYIAPAALMPEAA
ncbi:MAG: hypothetical protein IJN25_07595 [Clostridia bacterium]|nr:hypothetical protein [Clostridia bacterium]